MDVNQNTMHRHSSIVLFLIGLMLVFAPIVQARQYQPRIVWTKNANRRTGLYTTNNYFVAHGFGISANLLYYFGDVDNEGIAFNGGWNSNNIGGSGGLCFNYNLPVSNHVNLRFMALAGIIRADNKTKFDNLAEPRDDYRKFFAYIVQPSVGVQYYPFSNAGFYLYGGLAFTASIIDKYEFYYYARLEGEATKSRHRIEGKATGFLPMVQLAIGYSWSLTPSWTLSAEIGVNEGLIDTYYMNLDAFPMAGAQNTDGYTLGQPFGKWTDRYGKEHIHWNDGWFQAGITITYQWRNCETCRLNTNFPVKMRRR